MAYIVRNPTLDKLSRVIGYQARGWRDAYSELVRNRITEQDSEFLSPDDAETYRLYRYHLGRSYTPTYVEENVEDLERVIRARKTRFLIDACEELYQDERMVIVAAVANSLEQRTLLKYPDAAAIVDGRFQGTASLSSYGWGPFVGRVLREGLAEIVLDDFEQRFCSQNQQNYLTLKYWDYYFSCPEIRFKHKEVDILEFGGIVHSVVDVQVSSRTINEQVNFGPYHVVFSWTGGVLGHYTLLHSLEEPNPVRPRILPIALIKGLASGDQEPAGCHIVGRAKGSTTYKVNGYLQEVSLSDSMQLKIHDWVGKGGWPRLLEHFTSIYAMDRVTFEIVKKKSVDVDNATEDKKIETKAQAIVSLSDEEARKLDIASKARRSMSGPEWARFLGYGSRQGAYVFFEKMENLELLTVKKSDLGIEVTPTTKTLEYLKSLKLNR